MSMGPDNDTARQQDARLERWMGWTLAAGSAVATVLLGLGLLLNMAGIDTGLAAWLPHVGLVVLMATPVGRVVVSVVEYARQKDWAFLAVTLTVLGMLLVSLIVGLG